MRGYENSKIPRLFEIMETLNVKASDLANATGISRGSITDWKSGKSTPTGERLTAIAEYFGVSVEYLLGKDTIEIKDSDDNEMFTVICGRPGNGMSAQSKMIIQRVVNSLSEMSEQDQEKAEKMINVLKE